MAKLALIDELHLLLRVPVPCPEKQVLAARRVLRRREFQQRLGYAVKQLLASYAPLKVVRLSITR